MKTPGEWVKHLKSYACPHYPDELHRMECPDCLSGDIAAIQADALEAAAQRVENSVSDDPEEAQHMNFAACAIRALKGGK